MSALPYMRWYPADYLADTTHLTRDEHGGYRLLLDAAWLRGGKLPDDDAELARITKCKTHREWLNLRKILKPFFKISRGFWQQKRLNKELGAATKLHQQQSVGGQKTAAKRWQNKQKMNDSSASSSANSSANSSASPLPSFPQTPFLLTPSHPEPEPYRSPPKAPPSQAKGGRGARREPKKSPRTVQTEAFYHAALDSQRSRHC